MTITERITELKNELKELEKQKEKVNNTIKAESEKLQKLLVDKEALEALKSDLAKILLSRVKNEIISLENSIPFHKKRAIDIDEKYVIITEALDRILSDTDDFIDEQTDIMVNTTLDFIEHNMDKIGIELVYKFYIDPVTLRNTFENYHYPIGKIEIKGSSAFNLISDFPFEEKLYDVYCVMESSPKYVVYSPWFENYLSKFRSEFLRKLKARFKLTTEFELINDDTSFTLKLL